MMIGMIINEHVQDLLDEYGELFTRLMELESSIQIIEAKLIDLGVIA